MRTPASRRATFHTHGLGGGGEGPEHHHRKDHIYNKLHETDLTSCDEDEEGGQKTSVFPELEKPPLAAQVDMRMLGDSRKQCLPQN